MLCYYLLYFCFFNLEFKLIWLVFIRNHFFRFYPYADRIYLHFYRLLIFWLGYRFVESFWFFGILLKLNLLFLMNLLFVWNHKIISYFYVFTNYYFNIQKSFCLLFVSFSHLNCNQIVYYFFHYLK